MAMGWTQSTRRRIQLLTEGEEDELLVDEVGVAQRAALVVDVCPGLVRHQPLLACIRELLAERELNLRDIQIPDQSLASVAAPMRRMCTSQLATSTAMPDITFLSSSSSTHSNAIW